jgi:hypothetical protein
MHSRKRQLVQVSEASYLSVNHSPMASTDTGLVVGADGTTAPSSSSPSASIFDLSSVCRRDAITRKPEMVTLEA